jgi:hypothetical protein
MVDFTKEELYRIMEWAMDAADTARRGRFVNVHLYETAKSISDKAFAEITKEG